MYPLHQVENGGANPAQPINTAYQETGSGEPFLLIHGFTGSKLDFQDQLASFADTHRVIALDLRGHGDSSNEGPYDFSTLVADLFGFLDALQIERCHILGHSMGGMLLVRALQTDPRRFASAILMDTSAEPMKMYDQKTAAQLAELVTRQGCQGLLQNMRGAAQNKSIQREIAVLGEQEYWRRIEHKLTQMDPRAFIGLSDEISNTGSRLDGLKQVTTPTTVLVGREDKPFIRPSKRMARTLPQASLVKIDQAGHSPQYENPDAWRMAVAAHLQQHSP